MREGEIPAYAVLFLEYGGTNHFYSARHGKYRAKLVVICGVHDNKCTCSRTSRAGASGLPLDMMLAWLAAAAVYERTVEGQKLHQSSQTISRLDRRTARRTLKYHPAQPTVTLMRDATVRERAADVETEPEDDP